MFRADGKQRRCSGASVQQQVTMYRSQPAESRSNKKQLQDSQQRQYESGDCFGLRHIAQIDFGKFSQGEHMRVHPRKHHSRRRTLPLHGTHDKSLQSIMKCYDDSHQNLHDGGMSPNDADAPQGIGERMMKDRSAV